MPRPAQDYRNLLGKPVKVPEGLQGVCSRCKLVSETDGTEVAVAELDKHWNGQFYSSLGWIAFFIVCPRQGCNMKVQYETKWWVGAY